MATSELGGDQAGKVKNFALMLETGSACRILMGKLSWK
jgi:hypothetical protein